MFDSPVLSDIVHDFSGALLHLYVGRYTGQKEADCAQMRNCHRCLGCDALSHTLFPSPQPNHGSPMFHQRIQLMVQTRLADYKERRRVTLDSHIALKCSESKPPSPSLIWGFTQSADFPLSDLPIPRAKPRTLRGSSKKATIKSKCV